MPSIADPSTLEASSLGNKCYFGTTQGDVWALSFASAAGVVEWDEAEAEGRAVTLPPPAVGGGWFSAARAPLVPVCSIDSRRLRAGHDLVVAAFANCSVRPVLARSARACQAPD